MSTKLGQNFLKNKKIVKRIIESADLSADDVVLEIGPGKGILTEELAKVSNKVIAIEIDRKLVEILRNKFKNIKNIEIVENNVLKINLENLHTKYNIQDTRYKVIANLPYYITSPIIRMFLESEFPPEEMILMVQKEVAERIVAGPGQHSILSLSVQYYAKPEILFNVDKNNFEPIPEVDSAVIKIVPSPHPLPEARFAEASARRGEGDRFFRLVRAGFCAKRKILANNLANSFHLDKKIVEEKLKAVGISPIARAQELNLEDWEKLARLI